MNWLEINNTLTQNFEFKNFNEAFGFITRVAMLSEKHGHHPTWSNSWNKVKIELSTHDAGNKITEKDYFLANEIDKLLQ